MDHDAEEIARIIEIHEAEMWAACMAAAASVEGNPLKVELERNANTPLSAITAFNFGVFNRVVALGVETPASTSDIEVLQEFYSSHSQSRYLVELTPASRPHDLKEILLSHGLSPIAERVAKCWRTLVDIPAARKDVEVRELFVDDRAQVEAVNIAAWGVPNFFGPWFGATLGRDGFRHYGSFDGDTLVSTVAMYVTGDIAWSGFGATHPKHQGRGYQTARLIRILEDASAMGCRLFHNETAAGTPESPNYSLHNIMKVGFTRIYDKESFAPAVTKKTTT
jgi:GNAT superfamily N-acetyltransferase